MDYPIIGRHVKGPGGDTYLIRHVVSPNKIICENQLTGELTGLERSGDGQAWGGVGARYFGLRDIRDLPVAIQRYTGKAVTTKGATRRKPSFDAEGFDLQNEMETGYCISDNYRVSYSGKFVHDARGWDQALEYVYNLQLKQNDFSNVFYMNGRGNVDLIAIVPGKGRKPFTYKLIHSWV